MRHILFVIASLLMFSSLAQAYDCERKLRQYNALWEDQALAIWRSQYEANCGPITDPKILSRLGVRPSPAADASPVADGGEQVADTLKEKEIVKEKEKEIVQEKEIVEENAGTDKGTETEDTSDQLAASQAQKIAEDVAREAAKLCSLVQGNPDLAPKCDEGNAESEKARIAAERTLEYPNNARIYLDRALAAQRELDSRIKKEADRILAEQVKVRKLKKELEEPVKLCEKREKVAQECCTRPESCLTEPDGEVSENDGVAGDAIRMAMGIAAAVPTNSISSMCGKMQTIGNAMTVFNGYLGVQCSRFVSKCKTKCDEVIKKVDSAYASAQCDGMTTMTSYCRELEDMKSDAEVSVDSCKTADNGAMKMAQQAVASQMAARYAGVCKELAQDQKIAATVDDSMMTTNCASPTAATMSFCQNQCSRPGAENDPNCQVFNGLNGQPGLGAANTGGTMDFGTFGGDEEIQTPNFEDIQAVSPNNTPVAGASGGGLMGGGGDSGDSGGGRGDYGDPGHNTKIDRGLASGNGYSSVGGRMTSGASGGYSGGGAGKAITAQGKPFNLKDFMPGKNAAATPFRGLASAAADISPAHDDIFKKVTSRFYQLCLRDALYDCSSLQKVKRAGN